MLPIFCSLGRKNCALKVRNVKKTGILEDADLIESFIPFGRLPMDRGDHFKVVGLKKSGQYKETFRSVFRFLSSICAPSYFPPQQIYKRPHVLYYPI